MYFIYCCEYGTIKTDYRLRQTHRQNLEKLVKKRSRRFISNTLRLLRTFAGVLGEKIRMHPILTENTTNYISLESLINVDFGKKYKLPVSSFAQKKIANNHENDHVSFN